MRAVSLSPLRRLLRDEARAGGCDRCGAELDATHAHVADVESRQLLCVCPACAVDPAHDAAGDRDGARCRAVPERIRRLPHEALTDGAWDAGEIPVGIAFFFYNSRLGRAIACYPGPAGATESHLPADRWSALMSAGGPLEADVEALLARRTPGRREAFVVPITACYELIGRIRRSWSGFGGGAAADEIDAFFDELRAREEGP